MYGCNLFTKDKIMADKLIEATADAFDVSKKTILVVEKSSDWLKRKKESIVVEYNGRLPKDDDEYPDYHYYQLWYDEKVDRSKTDKLDEILGNDVIVDTE